MNLSSMGSARPYANAMDNTTARLRKAFKYPTDGDGDEDHEEMDEEEQEHLLQNLQESETSTNAIYTALFSGLPLVVILPLLWYLFRSTTKSMVLLCLLSITSLISSAYIMYMVPVSTPLGSLSGLAEIIERRHRQRQQRNMSRTAFLLTSEESPLNQYLPYLNGFISAVLLLSSWAYCSRTDVPEGFWLFLLLPGVIFGMVFMARRSMAEIQTGLNDLRGRRYGYKGA